MPGAYFLQGGLQIARGKDMNDFLVDIGIALNQGLDVLSDPHELACNFIDGIGKCFEIIAKPITNLFEFLTDKVIEGGTKDNTMIRSVPISKQKPQKGDVLYAQRKAYRHFGIYAGHNRVINYATPKVTGLSKIIIAETWFSDFSKGDDVFILSFPKDTHCYSPRDTVKRARSCIGQTGYNLASNNCEHFAVWCKTGKRESRQVENVCNTVFGSSVEPKELIGEMVYNAGWSVFSALSGIADKLDDLASSI
jgi:hypothetical protein